MIAMEQSSRDFLLSSFMGLREDTREERIAADPVSAARILAYCDAVIASLEHDAPLPHDRGLRDYLETAAKFHSEANEYERVVMEQSAWASLLERLPER
ncbi:MAG: hypothetical protein JSR84_00940 [Proteobacteria bacterium]|nr:hypothetical protein [Pseudomonadota bacterium]